MRLNEFKNSITAIFWHYPHDVSESHKKVNGKVLNIGGGNRISINDLINHPKRIIGSDSEVIYSKEQKGDAEHTLADVSCLNKLLGHVNHTNIEEGLSKFVFDFVNI